MSVEFKTLAEILHESRAGAPLISPLIAEPLAAVEVPEVPEAPAVDRLSEVRTLERFEGALRRLLGEIAAEVVGRELLLAPVDVDRIVTRLRARFGFADVSAECADGDLAIAWDGTQIDASLGRRLHSAIERALA